MDVRNRERARKQQDKIREFLERCAREVHEGFSIDDRDYVRRTTDRFNVTSTELVVILSRYSIIARLRLAIPLLAIRNPGRKFTHKELGAVVCTSRERVGKSLARLRTDGLYAGEITTSREG